MTRPTIEQIRAIGDFATLIRWNLKITKFPTAISTTMTSENFNLRVETTDVPKATNAPIDVNIRGHKVRQPGITSYTNTLNVQCVEDVKSTVSSFLKAWREICWKTGDGTSFPKAQAEGKLLLERLDNQDNVIWKYEIIGVFLEDYETPNLDGTSSDVLRPSMIFSYDYFKDEAVRS